MDTIKIEKKQVQMIAHRGVSGLEMENTNAAFVAAGNRTYYGVETDIHVTRDGQFAVIHDDVTSRVSNVEKNVEECSMEELKKVCLYNKEKGTFRSDLRIPVLEEYIAICKKYGKKAVLELKNRMQPEAIAKAVELIREQDYLDHVIFISFCWDNLMDLKKIVPGQKAQFLIGECSEEMADKIIKEGFELDIHYKHLTPELIQKFHANGLKVNCWTVDDPVDGERLVQWGVDYITSNILE